MSDLVISGIMRYNSNMKKVSHSPAQTVAIGRTLGARAHGGEIYTVCGMLGSGKTCLAKGFARGLGIKDTVASPTFVLVNSYPVPDKRAAIFCHADMYRLDSAEEVAETGLEDYLGRPDTVCLVEWPEKIKSILPGYAVTAIALTITGNQDRTITIKKNQPLSGCWR